MTPAQQKAMEMALEALETVDPYVDQLVDYASTVTEWPLNRAPAKVAQATEALRAALAEQADDKADTGQLAWTPTTKNINALPEPVREYIHNLEVNADPAGTVRDLTIARDTIRALEASNRMLRDDKADAERYRWLVGGRTLEQCNDAALGKPADIPQDHVLTQLCMWYCPKEAADQMIDAARSKS